MEVKFAEILALVSMSITALSIYISYRTIKHKSRIEYEKEKLDKVIDGLAKLQVSAALFHVNAKMIPIPEASWVEFAETTLKLRLLLIENKPETKELGQEVARLVLLCDWDRNQFEAIPNQISVVMKAGEVYLNKSYRKLFR
jgi:hypothetical protein